MTTKITNDEFDAALNELAAEQKAWFKDAREKQRQETAKRQTETSMRIAVAMWIGEYLEANEIVTYRARTPSPSTPSPSAAVRINFTRAYPRHN